MKNIGFLFLVIVFFSCQVPKEKMTGRNIRLWQDTPAWELAKAVRAGNTSRVNEILLKDRINIDYREPKYGQSLLFWAIWHNKTDMIQFLLSKGANPNLHDYFDGQSPITLAAGYYGEDIKMLKLLLEYGGDPNDHTLDSDSVTDMRSMSTPLINAATNDLEKVKLLIKAGADINLAVESGQPPLFRAIMNNRADVIRYLVIDQKADFRQVFIVTIQGDTLDFKDLLSGSAMEMVEESAKELSCVYDYLKQFE
ncbi:ankyrin repeat domain-containing protein [Bacteroides sp.]|uniref:ankyrin repeat domain-containing protein n=1 Tax=Bacteroides sp. TaxID=29523 RepID=UPI0025C3489B|nr:ankyrin repeat domain-containing protein [Bacteroides sp.]